MAVSAPALKRALVPSWLSASNWRHWPVFQVGVIGLFIVIALFGTWIAPSDPYEIDLRGRLAPPAWVEGGSSEHIFGTDQLGRDIFSRVIVGARASFIVAIVALTFGSIGGSLIGLAAGYYGGRIDNFIMRVADATIAFPLILLALLLTTVMGPGILSVVIAAGAVLWARFARLIRAEVLSVKERDYIRLARVAGASNWRNMIVHVLPNVLNSILVLLTLQLGFVIILESTLSFLGAGIPPPTPTWGQMVANGRDFISSAWWLSLIPGAAIAMVVLAFNLLGDWLRDTLDPKLRQV